MIEFRIEARDIRGRLELPEVVATRHLLAMPDDLVEYSFQSQLMDNGIKYSKTSTTPFYSNILQSHLPTCTVHTFHFVKKDHLQK